MSILFIRAQMQTSNVSLTRSDHTHPTYAMLQRGLPFSWDAKTIRSGLNFTLTTDLGDLDLFGEITGDETYNDLMPHSFDVEAFGVRFKCIDLPTLIRIKEVTGRAKDREAITELRVLLQEKERKG
jgi:predicted nucleotidyltransferase